jgi:rare lipoprotein A
MNKIIPALLILLLCSCSTGPLVATDDSSQTSITSAQSRFRQSSDLQNNDADAQDSSEEENLLPRITRYIKQGIASWYGTGFHGKKTSSGELYDMYAMTAAHKTLPIPSYARVTNLENQRSVIVLINDRGPFHNDRVMDLSYAAAKTLDIQGKGQGTVEIKPLEPEHALAQLKIAAEKQEKNVYLQVGTFSHKKNALKLQDKIASNHLPHPAILSSSSHHGRPTVYKVQMGPIHTQANVDKLNIQLAKLGIMGTLFVD